MGGKRIAPAELIPIVDVFAEDDDGGSGEGLFVVEFGEETIGGRATGTALGLLAMRFAWDSMLRAAARRLWLRAPGRRGLRLIFGGGKVTFGARPHQHFCVA
jgi:hypothetical protein